MPLSHHANIGSKLKKAQSLIQSGQLEKAERVLLPLTKRYPRAEGPWLLLGSVYGQSGRYQDVERCCRAIISINPGHPMGLSLLGSACAILGKHEEAIAHLRKAVELDPGNPGIHYNLGNALYAQGKVEEAETEYRTALQLKPGYAQAHSGLGNCMLAQCRWQDALTSYQAANLAIPDNYDINMSLGLAYQNFGKLDEAVGCYQHALQLTDRRFGPLCALSYAKTLQGHLETALDYLEQALRDQPENPSARVDRADIFYKMGRIDEAYTQVCALLEEGLETPRLVMVYAFLCKRFQECDKVIALAEDMIKHRPIQRSEHITLQYILGKLYDQSGDYEAAFLNFRQANESEPDSFDRAEHTRKVNRIIEAYSPAALSAVAQRALPRSNCRDTRPVFIVGMPRSGTSLIEQILASHPRVYGAGERPEIGNLADRLDKTELLDYVEHLESLDQQTLDRMAREYLHAVSSQAGNAERITDKMPTNFLHLGLIAQFFPAARIIHCRRDPRDTCLSIYFQEFNLAHNYAHNLGALAHFYREYERLMEHWLAVLDLPILEVNYSEIVSNLEDNARRMVNFLDLEWDPNCLQFHRSGRTTATASYDQVRQPVYTSSIGRWTHYRLHISPLIEEFGDQDAPLGRSRGADDRRHQG
jgi:tetratricopeptide (TPR) repeat protein